VTISVGVSWILFFCYLTYNTVTEVAKAEEINMSLILNRTKLKWYLLKICTEWKPWF